MTLKTHGRPFKTLDQIEQKKPTRSDLYRFLATISESKEQARNLLVDLQRRGYIECIVHLTPAGQEALKRARK